MLLPEGVYRACRRAAELMRCGTPAWLAVYKAAREWGVDEREVGRGLSEMRRRRGKKSSQAGA